MQRTERLTSYKGAPFSNVGLGGGVGHANQAVCAVLVDVECSVIGCVCNQHLQQEESSS